MATIPLTYCPFELNSKYSYTYRQKHNLKITCHKNLKKDLSHILSQHGFMFKHCKVLSSKKDKKEYKISTVAAYASELDLVVANETSNFEYDDNEWDVGIGNLIIDLDADIEKTRDEKLNLEIGMASAPSTSSSNHQIQTAENFSSSCSDNKSYSSSSQLPSSLSSSSTTLSIATCNVNTQSHNSSNIASSVNNSSQLIISSCKTNSCNISGTNHSSKMAVEHSATVDKGLKMKIKRTKPGTKSSEAKHEIVKSNEVNGSLLNQDGHSGVSTSLSSTSLTISTTSQCAHNVVEVQCTSSSSKSKPSNLPTSTSTGSTSTTFITSKRTSGNHRREKGRDKHDKLQNNHTPQLSKIEVNDSLKQNNLSLTAVESSDTTTLTTLNVSSSNLNISLANDQNISSNVYTNTSSVPSLSCSITNIGNNGNQSIGHGANTSQTQVQGSLLSSRNTAFQVTQSNTCSSELLNNSVIYSSNTSSITCSTINTEETKCSTSIGNIHCTNADDSLDTVSESPPCKRSKSYVDSDLKEMSDVCVGTSTGTITEPDCLGPCEPGTTVTLEGIVWHETEGGVLVVNITWRGKTYVGTLLDCTRHDWAPPRFCDSPTSDLDARSTKGRSKRGRTATNTTSTNDLSNFTETRSSVHSKLRNSGNKGRRGAYGSPAASPSSTAFIPPRADITNKRKTRCLEEDDKSKRKIPPPTPPSTSPPVSPVLLECPEPNCSKKYKHLDGLKYHQSHAHGSIDDDDIKEVITSMSENDESNIESPSPITPVKSPLDKIENVSLNSPSTNLLEPLSVDSSITLHVTVPDIEASTILEKTIVKPAILRYKNEDCLVTVTSTSPSIQKSQIHTELKTTAINPESPSLTNDSPVRSKSPSPLNTNSSQHYSTQNLIISSQLQHHVENHPIFQSDSHLHIQPTVSSQSANTSVQTGQKLQTHSPGQTSNSHHIQNQQLSTLAGIVSQQNILHNLSNQISSQTCSINHTISPNVVSVHSIQTHLQSFSNAGVQTKIPQFKVKPTAALMPDHDKNKDFKASKITNFKKKLRKSPTNSPHASPLDSVAIAAGRDDVQSPAYSDISDDAIPADETDTNDKILKQSQNKDIKSNSQNHVASHFSMYPYYGQSSYLIQNIQEKSAHEYKINDTVTKSDLKSLNIVSIPALTNLQNLQNSEKDKKESVSSQEIPESQSQYYTNYSAYISSAYPFQTQSANSQNLSHLPELEFLDQKQKIKQESQSHNLKEKHLENHQILKESIEIKSQMSPYQLYHNSESQRPSPTGGIISDDRRYYIYSGEQRRKEDSHKQNISQKPPLSPKHQSKQDKSQEINKNDESKIKQEGVKPTMETQGPPPPPTSQYAYIHPGYIPSHHYGSISYDTGHPGIYRNLTPMIVPGNYTSNPYLHQLPRYHAPEDLSRSPGGKALDLLQHHANQYYSNHKIHELQERALKSPIPKIPVAGSSPLSTGQPISIRSPSDTASNATGSSTQSQSTSSKQQSQNVGQQHQQQPICGDTSSNSSTKDNRSPPPQRHVHTHHHTHVGLGYPILPGQYPAPYGAAVLASQQAAAVAATVIAPFPPK